MEEKQIKFGIICHKKKIKKWQLNTINQLIELKNVECSLVIFEEKQGEALYDKDGEWFKFKNLFWLLYISIFRKGFIATKQVDFPDWLACTEHIRCSKIETQESAEGYRKEDIEKIKSRNLDFILNFGSDTIRGEFLQSAKYGIWSFQHQDSWKYRGGPPCFWEIYNQDNITGAVLKKMINKPNASIILKKGFIHTNFSYKKNLTQLFMESSRWPAQLCVDIRERQTDKFFSKPIANSEPAYSVPTNFEFVVFLYRSVFSRIVNLFKILFYVDYWNVGVAKTAISSFLNDEKPEVEWLPLNTTKKFIADPFALADPTDIDKLHIFFETYPFHENKGKIDHCIYQEGFTPEISCVLNKEYHLSYPYILTHEDNIYMVPETFENNNVAIYKATDFPYKWKKEATLIDNFKGIDSTVIKHDDTWWLFTSDKADGVHYNLQLFYSDDLFAGWTSHPKNPVKTDIRSSRSAGTPFEYEGALVRPSMDYSEKIEGRIVLNKILKLSKTEFEEISIKVIGPYNESFFSDKIHTLTAAGKYTIVDGCKECLIFSDIRFFKSKIKHLIKSIKS